MPTAPQDWAEFQISLQLPPSWSWVPHTPCSLPFLNILLAHGASESVFQDLFLSNPTFGTSNFEKVVNISGYKKKILG